MLYGRSAEAFTLRQLKKNNKINRLVENGKCWVTIKRIFLSIFFNHFYKIFLLRIINFTWLEIFWCSNSLTLISFLTIFLRTPFGSGGELYMNLSTYSLKRHPSKEASIRKNHLTFGHDLNLSFSLNTLIAHFIW